MRVEGDELLWEQLAGGHGGSDELGELLVRLHTRLPEDSLCGALGRWLAPWGELGPVPVRVAGLRGIPLTTRVDGILALTVPRACSCDLIGQDVVEGLARAGLEGAAAGVGRGLRRRLGLCMLAHFHGMRWRLEHAMWMELRLGCPAATGGGWGPVFLWGDLPLGGRIVVSHTGMEASQLTSIPPGDLEFVGGVRAVVREGGEIEWVEIERGKRAEPRRVVIV
jgi:hypothetical protein